MPGPHWRDKSGLYRPSLEIEARAWTGIDSVTIAMETPSSNNNVKIHNGKDTNGKDIIIASHYFSWC